MAGEFDKKIGGNNLINNLGGGNNANAIAKELLEKYTTNNNSSFFANDEAIEKNGVGHCSISNLSSKEKDLLSVIENARGEESLKFFDFDEPIKNFDDEDGLNSDTETPVVYEELQDVNSSNGIKDVNNAKSDNANETSDNINDSGLFKNISDSSDKFMGIIDSIRPEWREDAAETIKKIDEFKINSYKIFFPYHKANDEIVSSTPITDENKKEMKEYFYCTTTADSNEFDKLYEKYDAFVEVTKDGTEILRFKDDKGRAVVDFLYGSTDNENKARVKTEYKYLEDGSYVAKHEKHRGWMPHVGPNDIPVWGGFVTELTNNAEGYYEADGTPIIDKTRQKEMKEKFKMITSGLSHAIRRGNEEIKFTR